MAKKRNTQKRSGNFLANAILIILCVIWMIPIVGILITSVRQPNKIFTSGWWTVFPHKELVTIGEITIDDSVDVNGPITVEGVTATFEEWRQGIQTDEDRIVTWYGNKRTRQLTVSEERWIGFSTDLTLKNYRDVISGKTITYKDAQGSTITRQGNNLGSAFLNSLAVSIPGTIIPILIAAFAAYGFAWLKFPRKQFLLLNNRCAACSPASSGPCTHIKRLCETGSKRDLPGNLVSPYGIRPSTGYLSAVQLHQHPTPRPSRIRFH